MKALVIGGMRRQLESVAAAGYEVTWLISRDALQADDVRLPVRRLLAFSPDDSAEQLFALSTALHANVGFDRVFSFHDDSQALAIRLGEAIGCGFAFGMDALLNTRFKPTMRERLRQAGVPSCWSAVAKDADELVRLARSSGQARLIAKPIDGTGSRAVVGIESPALLGPQWVREHVHEFPVLLEQFLEGREYSVESFTAHGVHHFAGITEKSIDSATFIETGHVFPAPLAPEVAQAIQAYVAQALTALGVDNTPAHTEVMLTADGPRIIETHTRVGGDSIPALVEEVTGIDLYALGSRIQLEPDWTGAADIFAKAARRGVSGIRYMVPPAPGCLITSLEGVDEARGLAGVLEVHVIRRCGERTRSLAGGFGRLAYVRALGDTRLQLDAALNQAVGCIRFGFGEGGQEQGRA